MNPFQAAFEKIKNQQQLLVIFVFALLAVMVWMIVNLVTTKQSSTISPELKRLAKPLTPRINLEVIESLEQKQVFPPAALEDFPIYRQIHDQTNQPQIIDIDTPLPAENGLQEEEVATQSGQTQTEDDEAASESAGQSEVGI